MHDPFEPTASPRAYLPRVATEDALAALGAAARAGLVPGALVGPAGIGKTLLLHVLGERLGRELRYVILPHAGLELAELASWALTRLGLRQSGDPLAALLAHARELASGGAALLLLIDDAHTLSFPTARELGRCVARSRRALRLVFAAEDTPVTEALLRAVSPELELQRVDTPFTRSEVDAYLDQRLERAAAPPRVRERFHPHARDQLARSSGGIPGALDAAAAALLSTPLAAAPGSSGAAGASGSSAAGRAARRSPKRDAERVSNPVPRRQAPALSALPAPLWVATWALAAAAALALAGFIR